MFYVLFFNTNIFLDFIFFFSCFICLFGSFYFFLYQKTFNKLDVSKKTAHKGTFYNIFFNFLFFIVFFFYYFFIFLVFFKYMNVLVLHLLLVVFLLTLCLFIFIDSWFFYDKSTLNSFVLSLFFFTVFFYNILISFLYNFMLIYIVFVFVLSFFYLKKPKVQFIFRNKNMLPVIFLNKKK